MRYSASEKLEIIRLVEQSHLPVRRTLGQIGIPRSTFYRWYDQYQTGGPEALDDRSPRPDRVWNRIPDDVRSRVVTLALDEPELSPRELAVRPQMVPKDCELNIFQSYIDNPPGTIGSACTGRLLQTVPHLR
jgi:transposase-like protein